MNPNINNILILGATGFIGQTVYTRIRTQYPELTIHVLVRSEEKSKPFIHTHTNIYIGNLETFNWARIKHPLDYVLHFARNASSRGGRFGRYMAAIKGWYGNKRLLNFIKQTKIKRVFYLSGSLMYGHHKHPVAENTTLNPISFAREYIWAEYPFINAQKTTENTCNISFIRVPWVLGKGSWFQAFFSRYITEHRSIPIYGEGNNMMSFVMVSDIAEACLNLMEYKTHQNVYHLCYNKPLTQSQFVTLIHQYTSFPIRNIPLNTYESAIQEAFKYSIPLKPSDGFNFINDKVEERINVFLEEVL